MEDNPDEYEDEIQSAIGDALYAANIYPDDGEADYSNQTGLDQMIGVRVRKNMWFKGKVTCIWSHDDKSMPLWKNPNPVSP